MHKISHQSQNNRLGISILLNVVITVGQVVGGFISGSTALLSDALHNFSDVLALVISYIASRLSETKANVKQTFGFKRIEIIAAFINSASLIIIGVLLIIEAINRFINPVKIESLWVIVFALLSILLNGLSVLILKPDSKHSMNIQSAYVHLLTDMFTSIAVLTGGVVMYFYQVFWLDALLTLLIAFYLIFVSGKLFLESIKVLMLFTPPNIIVKEISERISSLADISNIHHVHVWQLNDKQIHFEAHVEFNENLNLKGVNTVINTIETILNKEFGIDHVTLQPEYKICHQKDLINSSH
ncbi:MAG: cation diffusion facilitator family transporter [Bacteroidales bacterium]|nr:cation diffusion facilitator family transporter [Bacteroidales bacterium]MCF8405018.1 cation diffusion facilitator family transporter [Bacteroidales bacterium]